MRFTLILATAALAAALPAERRNVQDTTAMPDMSMKVAEDHPATMTDMPMVRRSETMSGMSMKDVEDHPATMTDMPMVRRSATMAGMSMAAESTTAPMPATMSMRARDVAHGKKGNDEKKKTSAKVAAKTSAKMSMAGMKTMVVLDDPAPTDMPSMPMYARDVEHGKKGNDEKKKTSSKVAAKATSAKSAAKMSMAGMKTMVVLDDEPEATEMASMPMMARDVEHGKKGNDEKKKATPTKAAVKTVAAKTSAKMSMAGMKTMVVLDDEPEATEMASMPMMARDVEHGKKGNDEKKASSKMKMPAGKTMVVVADEPTTTDMPDMPMRRDVEHGKKGNDEKKASSKMKMPAGKTMVVLPAATTFVKVRREMTMSDMATMAMPASVHTVHHPAAQMTMTMSA